jgi:hypothetical protein
MRVRLLAALAGLALLTAVVAPAMANEDDCYYPGMFDNVYMGTDAAEAWVATGAAELFCGLGGDDTVFGLRAGDVFLGGQGNDSVLPLNAAGMQGDSLFFGGPGNDSVGYMNGTAEFHGGFGDDTVHGGVLQWASFFGGNGDDTAARVYGDGYFAGGAGEDTAEYVFGNGIFKGGAGNDEAGYVLGYGVVDAGNGDDVVYGNVYQHGTFYGRNGCDSVPPSWSPSTATIDLGPERGC